MGSSWSNYVSGRAGIRNPEVKLHYVCKSLTCFEKLNLDFLPLSPDHVQSIRFSRLSVLLHVNERIKLVVTWVVMVSFFCTIPYRL